MERFESGSLLRLSRLLKALHEARHSFASLQTILGDDDQPTSTRTLRRDLSRLTRLGFGYRVSVGPGRLYALTSPTTLTQEPTAIKRALQMLLHVEGLQRASAPQEPLEQLRTAAFDLLAGDACTAVDPKTLAA